MPPSVRRFDPQRRARVLVGEYVEEPVRAGAHVADALVQVGQHRLALTGTTAGSMIEGMGYVNFYLLTTLVAMPGVLLFWYMIRSGLADVSMGTAGKDVQRSAE